jgi:bifunctional non-homologous end joining protein LigD
MSDQLSLRLESAVPNLPATLRPMLDRPLPEAFDSPSHLFEPIWGGVRALAFVGPAEAQGAGDVTFVTESGDPIVPTPVDRAGLAARVAARSAVLDGELVVVDADGRLDHAELQRRLAGEPGRPLAYLAFDLLDLDGTPQLSLPLEKRRALLRRVLRPGDELVAVPAIAEEGRALFAAVAAQGLAGVRARQRSSPYLPGVRSRLWRSIAVTPGVRARADAAAAAAESDSLSRGARPAGGEAPVLALIARLPLGLEDESRPATG